MGKEDTVLGISSTAFREQRTPRSAVSKDGVHVFEGCLGAVRTMGVVLTGMWRFRGRRGFL